ncbi:MAG: LPS-assembly protein LptD, partial [Gammaproteobacteria bacterium]
MSWFSAPLPSQRWAYALTALVTATAVPVLAQVPAVPQASAAPGPSTPPPAPPPGTPDATVTAQAEEITGRPDRELNLIGDAELTRDGTRMKADTVCFRQVEDEVIATGNVQMWRFGDEYKGDELKLNLSSGQGYLLRPEYRMKTNNAQGNASRLDFLSNQEAVVTNGTYSTCEGPNPDWYLKASTLRLDEGRDVGVAGSTVVYFKGVPILGAPALSFSLSGARRSGWLPAVPGFSSRGGAELTLPYYFNIAPNRDLTLYPRYIFARGLQLGATGRYIGETSAGP